MHDIAHDAQYIAVDTHIPDRLARAPDIQRQFRDEMRYVARRQTLLEVDGKKTRIKPLEKTLIKLYGEVAYEAYTVGNDRVFLLRREQIEDYGQIRMLPRPRRGRVVMRRKESGELYIPAPDADIPLELTHANIADIGGQAGRLIRKALNEGIRDIRKKGGTPVREQRYRAVAALDKQDMREEIEGIQPAAQSAAAPKPKIAKRGKNHHKESVSASEVTANRGALLQARERQKAARTERDLRELVELLSIADDIYTLEEAGRRRREQELFQASLRRPKPRARQAHSMPRRPWFAPKNRAAAEASA